MNRMMLAAGIAMIVLGGLTAASAQQLAPGEGIMTYGDTLPKHGASAKKPIALKSASKKSGSKHHKSAKRRKSTQRHDAANRHKSVKHQG